MPQSKGIITPVLRYWGFSKHPFDDFILKGNTLSLFVDREDEVFSLQNALTTRLVAVYGSQGVGKSTFLRKTKEALEKTDTAVVYIQMTGTTEHALYREILAGILKSIIEGKIAISKLKINVKNELERLEKSIRYARETSFGANMIATGTVKEISQTDIEQHTEDTSRKAICDIITHKTNPFVVIVDDLERVKLFAESDEQYCRFISGFSRTVDEVFSDQGVCFVVSLDEEFVAKIDKNLPDDNGEISFSFGDLIRIPTFNPEYVLEIIRVRLKDSSWKKDVSDFITEEAFWCLCLASEGHPRKLLSVLRAAMELVAKNKGSRIIEKEVILSAANKRKRRVDEKDYQIIMYLQNKGPSSASDTEFQKSVCLTRVPLSERIKTLSSKVYLENSRIQSGSSIKDIISLPKVTMLTIPT